MLSDIYVVDIETTGLNPERSHSGKMNITEIVIKRGNGTVVLDGLFKPSQSIPEFITDLTGISNEMVKNKPNYVDVNNYLRHTFTKKIVVAHNATFEKSWLYDWNANWICTRALFSWIKQFKDGEIVHWKKNATKLVNVCEYYGVEYDLKDAHRAGYDVDVTIKVLKYLIRDIKEITGLDNVNAKMISISKMYMSVWGEK